MTEKMKPFAIAQIIFLRSDNGRDGWTMIELHEVPDFVKDPDRLGRMLEREEAAMDTAGDQRWYYALRVSKPAAANDDTPAKEAQP